MSKLKHKNQRKNKKISKAEILTETNCDVWIASTILAFSIIMSPILVMSIIATTLVIGTNIDIFEIPKMIAVTFLSLILTNNFIMSYFWHMLLLVPPLTITIVINQKIIPSYIKLYLDKIGSKTKINMFIFDWVEYKNELKKNLGHQFCFMPF